MFSGILGTLCCAVLSTHLAAADSVPLGTGCYVLPGAVNTGVFVREGKALLVDCDETVTPERLNALGVEQVETICMTQHRCPNVMGAYRFVREQGSQLVVSEKDRPLFEDVEAFWNDPRHRWHIYAMQPGPQVVPRPLHVSRTVKEGDVLEWRGVTLHVLETPGATDGAISYWTETDGKRLAFTGDTIYGPGAIWDLYSLQKGYRKVGDYHGFLGMREALLASLDKIAAVAPAMAIPSHGVAMDQFKDAAALLNERLNALYRNFVSISALNYYFPEQFEDLRDDPERMPIAEVRELPKWVRRVVATSFAVMADSKDALLVDCGDEAVVTTVKKWEAKEALNRVEGCWITHYHDDHVAALELLPPLGWPIITDARMAEILEAPQRFYLPCISQTPVPVARTTENGETWPWHEYTLTAFFFPGQTLYHGGLLVDGHGEKVFFAGDSGAPTGLDDYCAGNRTFLGAGRGSQRCIEIWRETKPDYIVNEHQDKGFRFTDAQLDYMDQTLVKREALIKTMIPWDEADFALDEYWLRAYPYDQNAVPGKSLEIQVHVTNHSQQPARVSVAPILPDGWTWDPAASTAAVEAPARTDGWVSPPGPHPDAVLKLAIQVPQDAQAGVYVIPLSVTYRDWNLGAFRHALVRI